MESVSLSSKINIKPKNINPCIKKHIVIGGKLVANPDFDPIAFAEYQAQDSALNLKAKGELVKDQASKIANNERAIYFTPEAKKQPILKPSYSQPVTTWSNISNTLRQDKGPSDSTSGKKKWEPNLSSRQWSKNYQHDRALRTDKYADTGINEEELNNHIGHMRCLKGKNNHELNSTLQVLCELYNYARKGAYIQVGIKRLARDLRFDEKTIRRAIEYLYDFEIIKKFKFHMTSTIYQLTHHLAKQSFLELLKAFAVGRSLLQFNDVHWNSMFSYKHLTVIKENSDTLAKEDNLAMKTEDLVEDLVNCLMGV